MSSTRHPVFSPGNLAVITGAASGIGLALSRRCVNYGMTVLMVDINADNLAAAKSSLDGKVETIHMDVAKIEDFEALKSKIQKDFEGKISFLALNAGIANKSNWADTAYFHRMMDVNLFGVIHGLNTLLPLLTHHSTNDTPTAIVITGSKQGITNPPGNPAYNASKAAVKTLTEHLAFDLSKLSPSTSTHLLIPGWTFTGITGNMPFGAEQGKKEKPSGAWFPDQVIDYLEKKMLEKKFYIICPDNNVTEALDQARMAWGVNDMILGRPPLTRWKEDWKEQSESWINETSIQNASASQAQ